jgi:rfaE bifunctional protein nucleotidyltransferase chain/domain
MSSKSKIVGLSELAQYVQRQKDAGKTVVHAHGVFDLIHPGHIRHLEAARKHGDVLVVTITPDHYVNKGPGRPVFTHSLRAEALAALMCVDAVATNEWATAEETIRRIRPSVYVKGGEYEDATRDVTGKIKNETDAVAEVGGRIAFTNDITFSSTSLLNDHFRVFSDAATEYLRALKRRATAAEVIQAVHGLAPLKVLLVGDVIIDEYHYVVPMNKSPKENVIPARYTSEERFAGGVLAAANHTASLCDRVDLVTCLGTQASHEEFIRGHLKPNVGLKLFFRNDAPTVVKRRFVEESYKRKLFEVCFLSSEPLPQALEQEVCGYLETVLPNYDLVLVTDFGHGLIGPDMVQTLCAKSRFLAVNVQTNSANMGYNLITKYPRADYISIDAPEARLATQEPHRELPKVIEKLRSLVDCGRIAITHGNHGCVMYADGEGFTKIPAFTTRVLDTVGAGDAFLAVSSPCMAGRMPIELAGVLGNAAGAMKVGIVGHRSSIEKVPLLKSVDALLK